MDGRDERADTPAVTAEEMGRKQREISVSEFFAKNRHLLGFDNPRKALLTAVKEAVDNSLDACEEARILPDVEVEVKPAPQQAGKPLKDVTRFIVRVRDNGPGIVPKQIPRIFGKLLYGSKFHRLRQSRGQQGIGISAAGMYGLITTGKPVQILSRTSPHARADWCELQIDTRKNEPVVIRDDKVAWDHPRGTEVAIEMEARFQRGRTSVDEYLEQCAIANPHASFRYIAPDGVVANYPRGTDKLPAAPREIRPHPHGVELGVLLKMLKDSRHRTLTAFLTLEFSRVSSRVAQEICEKAKVSPRASTTRIAHGEAETLHRAIAETKIMAPATDCLAPIGEPAILSGLHKQIRADLYTAVTRPPAVYRGNPFQIEAGLAYGLGHAAAAPEAGAEGEGDADPEVGLARLVRFANRVPLLYQQSACATYKAVVETNWRNYGVPQGRGALPQGPIVIFLHMASAWVPFTSESKEAIADYDEIRKEIRLALNECGRRLKLFVRRRERAQLEMRRRNIFALYIEEVAAAVRDLKGRGVDEDDLKARLNAIARKITGGEKTDDVLKKREEAELAELPNTLIVGANAEPGGPGGSAAGTGAPTGEADSAAPGHKVVGDPPEGTPPGKPPGARERGRASDRGSGGARPRRARSGGARPERPLAGRGRARASLALAPEGGVALADEPPPAAPEAPTRFVPVPAEVQVEPVAEIPAADSAPPPPPRPKGRPAAPSDDEIQGLLFGD